MNPFDKSDPSPFPAAGQPATPSASLESSLERVARDLLKQHRSDRR